METIHVIDFEGTKDLGISEFGITTLQDYEIVKCHGEHCYKKFFSKFEFFFDLRKTGVFGAHSAQVEDNLLRYYWASPGKVPLFVNSDTTLSWGPWVDTKLIYRKLFKNLSGYELNNLISIFGMRAELMELANKYCDPHEIGFHHSLFDSISTALLIKNLKNYFSNVSLLTLLSLYTK